MKKQLFLMLVLYATSMQVAVAGANGEAGANAEADAKQTEEVAKAGLGAMERSFSPEDSDSPETRFIRDLDDGYTQVTQVEKRTSSGSTPLEEVKFSGKICMSAKCNPSKDSEKDSSDNKKGTGTDGQASDANDQAMQQITNNNNNTANKLANDAANTVVVPPPPPPPLGCPPICAPPPPPPFCVVGVDPGCI